jgi:hypothetical protein
MPKTGNEFKYDQIRVVSWVDPGRVRGMMDGLTGLEVNEAIRDGRLPEPTLSRVLGIRCVAVSEGDVSAELTPVWTLRTWVARYMVEYSPPCWTP